MDKFEILEKKIERLENRILKLEHQKTHVIDDSEQIVKLENADKNLVEKFNTLGPYYLIIIALKLKSKQTKKELEALLLRWGAKQTIHGWFKGGNFSKRLQNTGILMKDGKNLEGEDYYSLTAIKGIKAYEELVAKCTVSKSKN